MSELAGNCEARTTAATSITLFDENDKPISDTGRTPEAWRKAQTSVGTDGLQARLLNHACALARGENPTPPVMRSAKALVVPGTVFTTDSISFATRSISARSLP